MSLAIVSSQISLSSSCCNPGSPLWTRNFMILWSVLWLLQTERTLPCSLAGHYHHLQVRKGIISLVFRNLRPVGKWRRNLFGFSTWFLGSSGFGNEGKGSNTWLALSQRTATCPSWSWLVTQSSASSWEWSNLPSRDPTCNLFSVFLSVVIKAVP